MIVKYPLDERFDHTLAVGPGENVAQAINSSLQANHSNHDQMDPIGPLPIPDLRRSTRFTQSRKPALSQEVLATPVKQAGGNKNKPKPSRGKLFVSVKIFPIIFDSLDHL